MRRRIARQICSAAVGDDVIATPRFTLSSPHTALRRLPHASKLLLNGTISASAVADSLRQRRQLLIRRFGRLFPVTMVSFILLDYCRASFCPSFASMTLDADVTITSIYEALRQNLMIAAIFGLRHRAAA